MDPELRLKRAQAAGYFVAGEPLAVDLADTIITVHDPPTDLLPDEASCRGWWDLQRDRLPEVAPPPPLAPTIELRRAVRDILDAHLTGAAPSADTVELVNDVVSRAAATRRLARSPSGWSDLTRWRATTDQPYDIALAVVADSLIDLLVGPARGRLRRCQNPACSMLFVASDARRKFCTQNICANRTRVARHYRRHRPD